MYKLLISIVVLLCIAALAVAMVQRTWHQKNGLKAEEYFEDQQVIALCKAIEAEDLQEIDRLVAAGANVNAQGKGNMTPLFWAWPEQKLGPFKKLLEHGANPNVIIKSDFNTGAKATLPGTSVTHLVTKANLPEHFKAVFNHSGDPNLVQTSAVGTSDTPLAILIKRGLPDKKKRIQLLIDKDVDLNRLISHGSTPPMLAASWGGQYGIALMLLKAGAKPNAYNHTELMQITHLLLREEMKGRAATTSRKADYQELVTWLKKQGESFEAAKADLDRWRARVGTIEEKAAMRKKEIAARKAREKRAQKAPRAGK